MSETYKNYAYARRSPVYHTEHTPLCTTQHDGHNAVHCVGLSVAAETCITLLEVLTRECFRITLQWRIVCVQAMYQMRVRY